MSEAKADVDASGVDRLVMPLDVKAIDQLFQNVERVEDERCESYRVRDQYGHDAGAINYLGKNEWRVFVDNFPSQKKYFAWNLPIKTVGEFIADIQRTGLVLVEA